MKNFFLTFFLIPTLAFGATPQTLNELIGSLVNGILKWLIPALITVAVVVFLFGITRFVTAGDNEEKRVQGRAVMFFGIITLFVMLSFWGFVNIINRSFFGKEVETPKYLPKPLGQSQQ